MKKERPSWMSLIMLLFLFGGALFWTNMSGTDDVYSSISKYLGDFGEVYKQISHRYVNKVDTHDMMTAGIHGMLNTLDPYTTYVQKEDQHQLRVRTSGKYEGVGLLLTYRNNVVTVAEPPFFGTPAERAGLREGDKIVKVDSLKTRELGYDKSAAAIRGPAGSEVTLTVLREGEPQPLVFKMKRERITVDDVRYAGFVDEGIGYIRLTGFSKNAGQEVEQAIRNFKTKDLSGLILDLRTNPGGLLDAAVKVSDLFLPKDDVIVSTRGRAQGTSQEFTSTSDPAYESGRLVILVNRISASASEIVAGAVQDHDRGVVLGDTTFGKGLVQSVIPLSSTSALKITTAKYYTPSGRCIQREEYGPQAEEVLAEKNRDYRTTGGRPVHGSGGIVPDIVLNPETVSDFVVDLRRKSMFFNYAVQYANTHEKPPESALVTEAVLDGFREFLKSKGYSYSHPAESILEELANEARDSEYGPDVNKNIEALKMSLEAAKDVLFEKNSRDIDRMLQHEMASKFYSVQKSVELALKEDPAIAMAVELLKEGDKYDALLNIQ